MKGKVAGDQRSSFTCRLRYWGKNMPLHVKNFFLPLLKACQVWESLDVPVHFTLRKGHIETGARTSCAQLEDTQRHLGQLSPYNLPLQNEHHTNKNSFREACRHLSLEWQQCKDMAGPKEDILMWLLSLDTAPACHAVWDVPVPGRSCYSMSHPAQVLCKKNPWINAGKLLRPGKNAKES